MVDTGHCQIRLNKRYSKIDQHLARNFEYYGACLSSPPPFQCKQIITPFLKVNDLHQSVIRVVILVIVESL